MLFISSCTAKNKNLRGSFKPSKDGKTYLIIAPGNEAACDSQFKIDGKIWGHKVGEPGVIRPGIHTITCAADIGFEIPAKTIYTFNYWGP